MNDIFNKQSSFIVAIAALFIILSITFIYVYVSILKQSDNAEQTDILNRKIIELDICGWNLLHVIFYFSVCYILNIRTLVGYILIFSTGIIWYFLEQTIFTKYNKNMATPKNNNEDTNNTKDYVYASISYPRRDDIIYNSLGILLHFFIINNCYFKLNN